MAEAWHRLNVIEAASRLGVDPQGGLDFAEATHRLRAYGPNRWREKPAVPAWRLLLAQFQDFMVLVLLAATLVSLALGERADAAVIILIVLLNAFLGAFQEKRAAESLESLRELSAPRARVLREGRELSVPADQVVPGDILLLEAGDRLPADGRLLEATGLEVEESLLTGESVPVPKRTGALTEVELGVSDQVNMVFQGTLVTRGRGKAAVVATGMQTEMGQIAGLVQDRGLEPTPLQRRLEQLGRVLVYGCLVISGAVVVTGILRGEPPYRMFLTGVSLAVAAIPEGLPAIVTVSLAVGVQRMIRRRAILRRLPAVETLGCATTICTDKTGTLTENRMTLRYLHTAGELVLAEGQGYGPEGRFRIGERAPEGELWQAVRRTLRAAALCSNATLRWEKSRGRQGAWTVQGDPTEGAILAAAVWSGWDPEKLDRSHPRLSERPFEAETRSMSVLCRGPEGPIIFLKGDLEVVLAACTSVLGRVGPEILGEPQRDRLRAAAEGLAAEGLRVLGVAEGRGREEEGLLFLGLVGLLDPPRANVRSSLLRCQEAGLRTIMITGDHPATALTLARSIGLSRGEGGVMTGSEMDTLGEEELAVRLPEVRVVARASPRHKLRLVRALRRQGEVVAMTGDGVNDAPAVKEADIGVAMGLTGTDLTKEASAMVLTDDNFGTIVAAIEEGRTIYENIRKAVRYLLSCNVGELTVMFLASVLGWPIPLLPIQILWVNLVTDGLPALALSLDPGDPEAMRRPPRPPDEGIFARGLGWKIMTRGLWIGIVTLATFWGGILTGGLDRARTLTLAVLVGSQLFHVFDARAEHRSIFRVPVWTNPFLLVAVASSVALLLAAIYLPGLQGAFHSYPLSAGDWLAVLGLAASGTVALELRRGYLRAGPRRAYALGRRPGF